MTRVLFVDDDELALQLMAKVAALLGYQPITSVSPREGLSLAASEKPALILVDMRMHEMDGFEFIRKVRQLPLIAHLPVILFSAGNGPSDQENALKAGANGFLLKPVGMDQLSQTIQAFAF